jgi:pilus assembly protein TadC
MLLLTPGFWVLLVAADPRAMGASLGDAHVRAAVAGGVILQILGALWISGIVRRSSGAGAAWTKVAMLRAVFALAAGRERSSVPSEVAEAADTLAFVLGAGYAPTAAVEAVAPVAPGAFGVRLRAAAARVAAGGRLTDALEEATAGLDGSAERFAQAFGASMSLGVPLAPRLRSLADEINERTIHEQSEDVRRASVRVLIPLGLLILPAFVLSCLVPLLVGGLSGIAGS